MSQFESGGNSVEEQAECLLAEARRTMSTKRDVAFPLLTLAQALQIPVFLIGVADSKCVPGELIAGVRPSIRIYRQARMYFNLHLRLNHEGLLNARERFTLAHEIGHWIGFQTFGVQPVVNRSSYWKAEDVVNLFASRLLVSEEFLKPWLKKYGGDAPMHILAVARLARQLRVSIPVLARRIVDDGDNINFLRIQPEENKKAGFPRLLVVDSATMNDSILPRKGFVYSQRVAEMLKSSAVGGKRLNHITLDDGRKSVPRARQRFGSYWVTWMRRQSQNEAEYWTSWEVLG